MSLYSIKLYIVITTSISWASSTCELFILIMQLANGAQIFKYYFFVGSIIWLISSCSVCNCYSSFSKSICITIITATWALDGWFGVLSNRFISYWYSVIFLYYSWIINNFLSGDIYLSLGIFLSCSFVIALELLFD